jgi:hypothetical protein
MLGFCFRTGRYLLEASPELVEHCGGATGRRRRGWRRLRRLLALLPKLLPTYLPGYTPHRIRMPPSMQELQDRYDTMARRTS